LPDSSPPSGSAASGVHPLDTPFVDDRKELVLEIGPGAIEFITKPLPASQIAVGVAM
jgi:hypothetical protein